SFVPNSKNSLPQNGGVQRTFCKGTFISCDSIILPPAIIFSFFISMRDIAQSSASIHSGFLSIRFTPSNNVRYATLFRGTHNMSHCFFTVKFCLPKQVIIPFFVWFKYRMIFQSFFQQVHCPILFL